MTLELRYAVRSDVGLLREGNEDSAYAGPRLLAVADGMGGHAAGEVASAVAISVLTALDEDLPASELLGALDGSSDVEPDLSLREAQVGDRYLLCSDGLSGVVSEPVLHRTLATVAEPDDAVRQLINLAIDGGGPDNITCIVADVVDSA